VVAKKHKEAVPVAGAAALAEEAFRHADKLSKVNESMYWAILRGFLLCAAILLLLFLATAILDLRKSNKPGVDPVPSAPPVTPPAPTSWFEKLENFLVKGSESKSEIKENYLSSLGFSLLVLLWAAVMVLYEAPQQTKKIPASDGSVAQESIMVRPLVPLSDFVKGYPEIKDQAQRDAWVRSVLSTNIKPGDVLFLLGSTDCSRFRGGNSTLAQQRADQASMWLEPLRSRGVEVVPGATTQQPECAPSDKLRAVFPFWIQKKTESKQ
jgi:hypothetical protein